MLVEKQKDNNEYCVGDMVKVSTYGITGKLLEYVNGRWRVSTSTGGTILVEESYLTKTQLLFG